MSERLASEKIIVSAPTSFTGSAQRIWKITDTQNLLIKWVVLVPLALCIVMIAWTFVVMWYFIIFGLFGIFVIPFRLWTRGSRKNKRNELRHREILQAINEKKVR